MLQMNWLALMCLGNRVFVWAVCTRARSDNVQARVAHPSLAHPMLYSQQDNMSLKNTRKNVTHIHTHTRDGLGNDS